MAIGAMKALKEKADKTELTALIERAKEKNEADYTKESFEIFKTALDAAEKVAADDNAEQSAADEAKTVLAEAMQNLVEKQKVNKGALQAAIEEADKKVKEDYTEESFESFERVLKAAKEVYAKEDATQEEVDNQTALLNAAMANLVAKPTEPENPADKSKLESALEKAEALTRADYTEETWNIFAEALEKAQRVAGNENAAQEEVDEAVSGLESAMAQLEKVDGGEEKPSVEGLKALVEKAEELNKDDYVASTWDNFAQALEAAKAVLDLDDATQTEIEAAKENLQKAMEALLSKTGWQVINGQKYYYGEDGIKKTGWQEIDGKKYYFGEENDGAMKTGWQTIYGKKYYLGGANDGAMKTGWQQISGYWYYFGGADDGSLKTNTWIGNYYVDGNGRWTKTRKTDKQILSEFISGGNYKRYTNGYSNLSYAIADLNADSVPELLIESKTEASGFYVTWVFTLDKNKNVVPVKVEDSELVLEEYASYGYGQFRYSQKYKAVIVSTTFRSNSNLGDIPFYKLQGTSLKHSFNIVWDKWDNPSNYRYDSNGNKTEITKSEIEVYKQELIDFSWTQFGSWTKSYSETDESQPVVQSANESENQNESPVVIPEETQGDEQNGEQNLEQDENKEVEQDTKVEQDAEIQEDEEIQADEEISEQPSEESQSAETQKTEEQVDE